MGRQRSPDSVRRIVSFRVNEDEYLELERWSSLSGKPISSMLREVVMEKGNPFDKDTASISLADPDL